LRIATIFTYGNEDSDEANDSLPDDEQEYDWAAEPRATYISHSRDKLESYIGDYNTMYGTSFTTKDSESFQNISKVSKKRLKEREKESFNNEKDRLDIVIVNMMLTGFDAKKVNTLYVDKNLKQHGIQAFSGRIEYLSRSHKGTFLFRNLKSNRRCNYFVFE
jgi:type I restriction enzyme R subunit